MAADDGDTGFRLRSSDPFATPAAERDQARRFRGRLVAPVTVWTAAGSDGRRVGLTISSLVVVEGDPPSVMGLVGPVSDFWEAVTETKRFVVHVLEEPQRRVAEDFAGRNPGPDAPYGTMAVTDSDWGPLLDEVPTRGYCTLGGFLEAGYFLMVRGDIDHLDIPERGALPLAFLRGDYVTVRPRRP